MEGAKTHNREKRTGPKTDKREKETANWQYVDGVARALGLHATARIGSHFSSMCDGDYHSVLSYFAICKGKGVDCMLSFQSQQQKKFEPFWNGMALDDFCVRCERRRECLIGKGVRRFLSVSSYLLGKNDTREIVRRFLMRSWSSWA
jgi:hypothetical protein